MSNATVIAHWESRGGKYWVTLTRDADGLGVSYEGRGCWGYLGHLSDAEAIADIERRLPSFQADATKTPMQRKAGR